RVITYRIYAPDLPCHGEVRRLATTLLDPKQAPAKQVIALYHERWEIELSIDEHKTHLRQAQQPLRSRCPQTVLQEFYGMLLLHHGLRFLMHQAATEEDPAWGAGNPQVPSLLLARRRRWHESAT